MVYVFMLVRGIGALVMGSIFAFRPEMPADMYIAQAARFPLTNRLRERLAPRAAILIWYRIGGVVLMILGTVIPVLALTGVIPIDEA